MVVTHPDNSFAIHKSDIHLLGVHTPEQAVQKHDKNAAMCSQFTHPNKSYSDIRMIYPRHQC